MSDKKDDKTVFGKAFPTPQSPAPQPPQPQPPQPQAPQSPPAAKPGGGRTLFGVPLPPAGSGAGGWPPPSRTAPVQPPQPAQQPAQQPPSYPPQQPQYPAPPQGQGADPWASGGDDTWFNGRSAATPPPQPPSAPQPQGWGQPQPQQPVYQPQTGARPQGAEFFPQIPTGQQPPQPMVQPRIALSDALRGTGLGKGGPSNPIIASAANLMILLGRLRTGLVEMQAGPLIEHVAREIDLFERNAMEAGVSPQDARDAKYILSATADDIVQNLPGADRGTWLEYSMAARFFGDRNTGVGFFQKVDEAMRAPAQRYDLLELMLSCLSLGFEGQFRNLPQGAVELSRIRAQIYESLRRVHARPGEDISVNWLPVTFRSRKRRGGVPVWAVASFAALLLVALFGTLSTLLTRQSAGVRDQIIALHTGQPAISIERSAALVTAYVAPPTGQMERIQAAMAGELASGAVEVEKTNDWILVRMGDVLQFAPGKADLKSDFTALADALGTMLNGESGPVRVVGHTDSIPPSGRGQYKTNESLSDARAKTVAEILKAKLDDPGRVTVEGMGAAEPIATNDTPEGRARNRRVEIQVRREE